MSDDCNLTVISGVDCSVQALIMSLVLAIGINVASWAISAALKTEKLYDFTGMIANVSIVAFTLGAGGADGPPARQVIASAMIAIWTTRLGLFLFFRALRFGDSRFHEIVGNPSTFLIFFVVQGIWCWLNSMPVAIINGSGIHPDKLQAQDIIGPLLWVTGMLLECVADFQKLFWKMHPANKGKFVDIGLWSYARYPNYGGEIALWWGLFIFTTPMLRGWQFVSVLSPLITMLLLFKASGIPLQEKQQQERWGSDPEFQRYRQSTSLLYPLPWKRYERGSGGVGGTAGSAREAAASNQENLLEKRRDNRD